MAPLSTLNEMFVSMATNFLFLNRFKMHAISGVIKLFMMEHIMMNKNISPHLFCRYCISNRSNVLKNYKSTLLYDLKVIMSASDNVGPTF